MNAFQRLSALLLLLTISVHAKARFFTLTELISQAPAIAIVRVEAVEPCNIRGEHWTYSQSASAEVLETIKGRLPARIVLVAGENFECAQVQLQPGRHLVFLSPEGDRYRACNWSNSYLAISSDNRVLWFPDQGKSNPTVQVPLETALDQIRNQLKEP